MTFLNVLAAMSVLGAAVLVAVVFWVLRGDLRLIAQAALRDTPMGGVTGSVGSDREAGGAA